ncbi:MAG: hypothetical protein ACKO39_10680, partial [Chthoniobacterales bacterium]
MRSALFAAVWLLCPFFVNASTMSLNTKAVEEAFKGKQAVVVVTDTLTGETYVSDPALGREPFGPCSTFKIWNTLIGLELGILKNP